MSRSEITSPEELPGVAGPASRAVFDTASTTLRDVDRRSPGQSPLHPVAAAAADGLCEVSPRGSAGLRPRRGRLGPGDTGAPGRRG
ncbi:hypothetical protein EBF04_11620 [Streptomyces sp. I6]|nr:hypothetical protein EBF04_11620 [Streptomyces sp. I6]